MHQIDLLIFDEAHHTTNNDLYNLIMIDFFYQEFDATKRPWVLALTASPIKSKLEEVRQNETDIGAMMKDLANNLYSEYVPLSKDAIEEFKKEI